MAEAAIIVLAGQSNMAGRGGVTRRQRDAPKCWDQVLPPECQSHRGDENHIQTRRELLANAVSRLSVVQQLFPANPFAGIIKRLSAACEWEEAAEPLHADIDKGSVLGVMRVFMDEACLVALDPADPPGKNCSCFAGRRVVLGRG